MDLSHRNNLRYCRQKIVEDLDVVDVIDHLIENGILDDEAQERILAERTRRAQVRCLLDTLPSRGPRAYKVFLESLQQNYSWLAESVQTKQASDLTDFSETSHLNDILLKGGVPHPPSFSIARARELEAIKHGLSELVPGRFLTLHGMPGSGKSVLAAESVRDPAVTLNNFPGGVFWFKVGMVDTDQLLNKLRALCTKLDAPALPTSIEEAQEVLRKLFLSRHLADSLLILDDVWRPEVIKTFTLPVRILVTTQDVSVMEIVRSHYKVVEIRSGFTEAESLQLFSSYLKVPSDYLPAEARAIHEECKGSPMVISLIGSLISESGRCKKTQRQSGRWNYYLNNLKTRRYSKLSKQARLAEHESVMGAVQMSVDNLEPADRERYEKLAVFLDDEPIPIKTLEVLWQVDKYEVEDTMNTFLKKCLASCEADSTRDSLVYTLHDLQLDYLKNKLRDDPEREKHLHRQFVEEYFRRVKYKYEDIKCDGYIFGHLGHHLTMAGLTPLFPDIYLNLGYVEASLKATGPVDILSDYRKYRQYIMGEDLEHEEALQDFEDFCRCVGAGVQGNKEADIVQLGLMEEEDSQVYLAARRLADTRPETLYLEWRNRSSVTLHTIATMNHPGPGANTVRFLPDGRLGTGGADGNVLVWNCGSGEILQRLHGHTAEVADLCVDPGDEDTLCSVSEDGALRQWRLRSLDPEGHNTSGDASSVRTNSLKRRRGNRSVKYSSTLSLEEMFLSPSARDEAATCLMTTDSEEDVIRTMSWRPGTQEVAVAGRAASIRVFDLGSSRLVASLDSCHGDTVNSLAYSSSGDLLASGSDDCTVRVWRPGGQFHSSLNLHSMRVTCVRWLGARSSLVTASAADLLLWHAPGSEPLRTAHLRRNRATSWTCVAASERSVAAGTAEDKLVLVWDADTCQVIAALPGQTSPVSGLDFSVDGFYLASISEETLMVWSLADIEAGAEEAAGPAKQPLSLGPPHMTRWRDRVAVTAAPDDMNRMVVIRDGEVAAISPVEESHVTCLMLSRDLARVVFGTADGWVKVFSCGADADSEGVRRLVRHEGPVTSVVISDHADIVVSGSTGAGVRINHLGTGGSVVCRGSDSVRDVRIVQRGERVLSCSLAGKLHLWNIHSGKLELVVTSAATDHATCLDVAERADTGETVAAVSGVKGGVKIVELRGGQRLVEVGPASAPVRVVRFSPDGKLIVTGHDTGTVQIWDAVTGCPISSPLTLHSSWVTDISISSDCSTLLTAGDRLVWWSLPAPPPAPALSNHAPIRRKLSLPIPRSRRSSGSKSNRDSLHEDMLSLSPQNYSPIETFRRNGSGHFGFGDSHSSLPSSPVGKRKLTKTGSGGQKELLQTFDIKGSSVNKVWVNKEFTQFVTVDDAGICYILDEFIPSSFS